MFSTVKIQSKRVSRDDLMVKSSKYGAASRFFLLCTISIGISSSSTGAAKEAGLDLGAVLLKPTVVVLLIEIRLDATYATTLSRAG